jgi:NAD(P)-dependent dehydrogenase (short-subunit alcohol dehydrogenase family)
MKTSNNIFSLKGQNAIVIGGGGHLCSAIAGGFSSAGASVLIADLRVEKAMLVADKISENQVEASILTHEVDASSKISLRLLRQYAESQFGKIDILVNGAGINSSIPFLEISEIEWHEVINSQLTATMLGCQVFGEHMLGNKAGSIINISSASADPALSRAFAYSAAKAGIRNLTQNLGREWAKEGVRVNALRPGFFPTEWNRKNFITKEREDAILKHTPLGRFGETEELIGATIYLASEASNFVTGSELVVDGGFSAMTI